MEKAYASAYKRYEKRLKHMAAMRMTVFSTVDEGWIENLRRDNAPLRQILAHLRDRLQPNEYDRMAALQQRRDQLKRVPKQDPLKWISQWRMLYDDMVKMGEFNLNSLIADFLSINREIDTKFMTYVKGETRRRAVLGKGQLTFYQIALMFEEEYREKALDKLKKGGKAASAFAVTEAPRDLLTLNGRTTNNSTKSESKPCICGAKHALNECYYLHLSIRQPGWQPKDQKMKEVEEALSKKGKSFQQYIECLKKHVVKASDPESASD
ncbi:hypothetical protein VTO42DRAFT_2570 [Malbranchea cinnamomea]